MSNNLAYQENDREELIDGELVMMSPSPAWVHVSISGSIYNLFFNYLRGKTCKVIPDGFDLRLSDKNRFIPDGMIVCDRNKIKPNWVEGAPDLVWEVLSPRTAKNDRWSKKNAYEASGVLEYWIVDPAGQSIEVYLLRDGRYVLDNIYTLYTSDALEGMTEEEKSALVKEFKCHLYDDLPIRLEDIFGDLL